MPLMYSAMRDQLSHVLEEGRGEAAKTERPDLARERQWDVGDTGTAAAAARADHIDLA